MRGECKMEEKFSYTELLSAVEVLADGLIQDDKEEAYVYMQEHLSPELLKHLMIPPKEEM